MFNEAVSVLIEGQGTKGEVVVGLSKFSLVFCVNVVCNSLSRIVLVLIHFAMVENSQRVFFFWGGGEPCISAFS